MTEQPNYNDGRIHGWNGGEIPVHPKTTVELWMRNGGTTIGITAGNLRWGHNGKVGDIIAFRVLKEYRDPREFWINIYPDGASIAHDSRAAADVTALPSRTECVHVREVL